MVVAVKSTFVTPSSAVVYHLLNALPFVYDGMNWLILSASPTPNACVAFSSPLP